MRNISYKEFISQNTLSDSLKIVIVTSFSKKAKFIAGEYLDKVLIDNQQLATMKYHFITDLVIHYKVDDNTINIQEETHINQLIN